MVGMGAADELEERYMAKFSSLVAGRGVLIDYRKDRFGVDSGLQFYVEGAKADSKGKERKYFHATSAWIRRGGRRAVMANAPVTRKNGVCEDAIPALDRSTRSASFPHC